MTQATGTKPITAAGFAASDLLRPVDALEADRISPWPGRLSGKLPWTPRKRQSAHIAAEYDRGTYESLLAHWKIFRDRCAADDKHPGLSLAFFDAMSRLTVASMAANPEVYGPVDLRNHLLSVNQRLFAGDVVLMEALRRTWITEQIWRGQAAFPFDHLLELGCGSGINLANAYVRLGLESVAGMDCSPNAVNFLSTLAADVRMRARFATGDGHAVDSFAGLAPERGNWALLSVHAIEQLPGIDADWFARLAGLENPPVAGMHFEPLHWGEDEPFARDCLRYALINGYNTGFVAAARQAAERGIIRIVHTERRVLGQSPYNPTSVLVWTPCKGAP